MIKKGIDTVKQFFEKGLTLRQFFFIGGLFWIVAYPVSYLMFGESPLGNITTVALGVSLAAMMSWAVIRLKDHTALDLIEALFYSMALYFFPRIFEYLAVHPSKLKLLYILFPMNWSAESINKGLSYVVIGTAFILLGLLAGANVYRRIRHHIIPYGETKLTRWFGESPSLLSLIVGGVIIYGVDGYYTIWTGLSAASNCTDANVPFKWLIHFFSGDIYILAVIVYLLGGYKKLNRGGRIYLFLSILVFLIYMLLLGSRGGVLRVLTIVFALTMALGRNFKIKIRTLFILVPMIWVSSYFTFIAGTVIREYNRYRCAGQAITMEEAASDFNGYEASEKFVGRYSGDSKVQKKLNLSPKIARIFDRLGLMDYPIGIVSMPGDPEALKKYINFTHPLKNLINNLVPGTPFPEAEKMTNNMFPIIYRGMTYKQIVENFLSEPYTIWGLGFIYFGYIFGLLFIFLSSALLQFVYEMGCDLFKSMELLYKTSFLWLIAGDVFFNMGFDHALLVMAYSVFQISTTVGFIYGIWFLQKRILGSVK